MKIQPLFVIPISLCLLLGAIGYGLLGIETKESIAAVTAAAQDEQTAQLAQEIAGKGWIAFSARSKNGTWDLFLMRPDGSQLRNITNTPDTEEAAPLFTQDGKKMLYRRMAKGAKIDHDLWGFQGQPIISNPDGSNAVEFGGDREYAWATWSPDASQIATLTKKEIQIVDVATKKVVRTLPRAGIYQQMFWSPDGKWFTGTANYNAAQWCVVRMNAESGEVNPIITFQSCTPDWSPDGHIIFASRPKQSGNGGYGWTVICSADGDGQNLRLIYGEEDFHIYGVHYSPDNQYVIFTKSPRDGGAPEDSGAPICVMRTADAPTIKGRSSELRRMYPDSKDGTVLTLHKGWEPCWTYAEIGGQ